jgi:uncharacterized protein YbaP (TraB family)
MNTIRIATILLLFLTSIFNEGNAQSVINPPISVLWKVKKAGSEMTSYLLGSVHTYGSTWVSSYPLIDSLVSKQEIFICENTLSIDTAQRQSFGKAISSPITDSQKLFGKDNELVRNHFLETTDLDIKKILDTNKKSNSFLFSMYYILLYQLMEKRNLKMSADFVPMDDVILKSAQLAGKQCIGLDEISSLSHMLSSEKQINSISSTIIDLVKELEDVEISKNRNKEFQKYLKMMDEYNSAKFSYDNIHVSNQGVKIVSRNKLWMKSLPKLIDNSNCFIVVGIMHLNGKEGLVNKLKESGYDLTSVEL